MALPLISVLDISLIVVDDNTGQIFARINQGSDEIWQEELASLIYDVA